MIYALIKAVVAFAVILLHDPSDLRWQPWNTLHIAVSHFTPADDVLLSIRAADSGARCWKNDKGWHRSASSSWQKCLEAMKTVMDQQDARHRKELRELQKNHDLFNALKEPPPIQDGLLWL